MVPKSNALPMVAMLLQATISALFVATLIFLARFAGPGIDAEKHRPSDQPTIVETVAIVLLGATPVAGTVLLSFRKRAGWFLTMAFDTILTLFFTAASFGDFMTDAPLRFKLDDFAIHGGAALLLSTCIVFLCQPRSQRYFSMKADPSECVR
jgi:hypothetical protein